MSKIRTDIICIVGPTACHKTEAAIAVAKAFGGEIVSADSVQVYIDMDIGSAKAGQEERRQTPHHMIDCVPIDTPSFSVSQYRELAVKAIDGIVQRKRLPIIVGGSGLYLDALTKPLHFAVPSDPDVRRRWEVAYDLSPVSVWNQLSQIDPQTAARLHLHDKKRIVRAMEVHAVSGRALSSFSGDASGLSSGEPPYTPCIVGLNMERERLYRRIDARVDRMMQDGLLQEARGIYDCGYSRTLPAMQSIGYRQLFQYFDGACTLEQAVDDIKRDTRRYAKRQLTWFRRDARIRWFDVDAWNAQTIGEIVQYIKGRLGI